MKVVGKKDDGTDFVALLLEPGNLHRIRSGSPARISIEESFPDGIPAKLEVLIYYSETPVTDARELHQNEAIALDAHPMPIKTTRPHCPECRSTIEEIMAMAWSYAALNVLFCPVCGCLFGLAPAVDVDLAVRKPS